MNNDSLVFINNILTQIKPILFWGLLTLVLFFITKRLGLNSHPLRMAEKKLMKAKKKYMKLFASLKKSQNISKATILRIKKADLRISNIMKEFKVYLYEDRQFNDLVSDMASRLDKIKSLMKAAAAACIEGNGEAIDALEAEFNEIVNSTVKDIHMIVDEEDKKSVLDL